MDKDKLVHEIGAMLLDDEEIKALSPWQHLVMVAQIRPGTTKVNGFIYRSNGKAVPASPDNFDILKKFRDLQAAMLELGKDPWKAALVRIDQPSLHLSIDFEYDNPEKWWIDPTTVKKMAETLRPPN